MGYIYPMIDLLATGKRIKELRIERGISVRELQMFLGFEHPQAIYKWQRGECLPSFDNMYAMACYFNVKIDDILVGNRQDFFVWKYKKGLCTVEVTTLKFTSVNHPLSYKPDNMNETKIKYAVLCGDSLCYNNSKI